MRLVLPVLALFAWGCSFSAIQRVPSSYKVGSYEDGADLQCSDGLTYPLIDMAGTILAGVLAVSLISSSEDDDLRVASISSAAIGIGFAVSSVYGLFHVNRCRQTKTKEGVTLPNTRGAVEDRERPGTHGGVCNEDGSCEGDLICDKPMQVCVPLREAQERP